MSTETTTTEKVETATTEAAVTTTPAATTIASAGDTTEKTETTDTKTETVIPDWRAQLAGEDKEELKRLSRFTDQAAFYKSYRALEGKLSSGEFKKALPETATPEEKATWRKENGLPEKAEGYFEKLALPNGVVLGEADKPIVAEFAAAALEDNVSPKQLSSLVARYYAIQDAQKIKQEDDDAAFKQASEDALHVKWQGADYRRNLNAVSNLMATWPEGLAARVLAGRTPDGRKLGDDPDFIEQLAALSLELNPFSTLVPAGTSDPAKTASSRLEEIRDIRRNKPDEYQANIKKFEAEELELIDAQLKMKSRAA